MKHQLAKMFFWTINLLMLIHFCCSICPPRPRAIEQWATSYKTETFYVDADKGSDMWSGELMHPNENNNDGPFRTLAKAVRQIRKKRGSRTYPATLFLRSGIYFLERKIILDSSDTNLRLMGFPLDAERPVISGALKIAGSAFKVHSKVKDHTIYVAPFAGKCSAHAFLGSKRLLRARAARGFRLLCRKPNIEVWTGADLTAKGPYLYMKQLLEPSPKCDIRGSGGFKQRNCPERNKYGFQFFAGDLESKWTALRRIEILVFNAWTAQRGKVRAINTFNNTVHFQHALRFPIGKHPKPSGFRYVVENVFEELDAVGEFYCDPDRHLFFIIPPPGELPNMDVYVSQTDNFFQVRYTNDIRFSDIAFHYTHDNGFSGYNAKPAAIDVVFSKAISITHCEFRNIGYTGIFVKNSVDVQIVYNSFTDIGYKGVSTDYSGSIDDEFATRNLLIYRNTFVGCGVNCFFQPACVHVKGVRNIHVSENDISFTPYAGIMVGWQKVFTLNHVDVGQFVFHIKRNNVHHYGNKILNDFAGIYLSSNMWDCGIKQAWHKYGLGSEIILLVRKPRSPFFHQSSWLSFVLWSFVKKSTPQNMSICHIHALISHNAIHHSDAYFYGAIGVFGDTAVSSLTVRDNWFYKLSDTAINFHCGQNNVAVNNMIHHTTGKRVFGTCNKAVGPGGIPRQILKFLHNVIYVDHQHPRMYGRGDFWTFDVPIVDYNIYYFPNNTLKENVDKFFPKGRSFQQWRSATGNDEFSVIADPQFEDINSENYNLKDNSPAQSEGIGSFNLRPVVFSSGSCHNSGNITGLMIPVPR